MRNPLKRRPSTDPKPSLRERLRATKAKAGKVLAVNRILLRPDPKPVPAVDRIALVNYATFLTYEHRRVQGELYPHMSPRKRAFTLGLCAAERFFFGPGSERGPDVVPPPSTRAVRVLDFVGVAWREDLTASGRNHLDNAAYRDNGERPPLPHGWPALDAELVTAISDLVRIDATIDALHSVSGRYGPDLPEYEPLERARKDTIATLIRTPAEGLLGLQAKARAAMTDGIIGDADAAEDLAQSVARDLLGLSQRAIERQPDPIFEAIEECRRLETAYHAAPDAVADRAGEELFAHWRDVVLKTVPRTAEGCQALAAFSAGFFKRQDGDGDDTLAFLDLIARSPLL